MVFHNQETENAIQSNKQQPMCTNSPRGSQFEFADLLRCPVSECLTLAHLTSAPLGQDAMESSDGLFVYKWENAGSKRCTQVSEIIHAMMLEYSSYTENIGQMYHCDARA